MFAWLISHQPTILFSQNKPAISNQPTVLFSQNKPAPAISNQPNEQAAHDKAYENERMELYLTAYRKTMYLQITWDACGVHTYVLIYAFRIGILVDNDFFLQL
jgi:hypothetical protein